LTIDKNKIPDIEIIKMSYLDFLFYLITHDQNGEAISFMFAELLKLCLKLEYEDIQYYYDDNGKVKLLLNLLVDSDDKVEHKVFEYDKNDFEEIKEIILYQNIPSYDNSYIDPKVEAILKEAEEFVNRHNAKMASLEDQMICVLISTSLSEEQIYNLTIRKFAKILQRVDHKMHYEIYKSAECGGATFKDGIKHWMCDITKNKYSDVIMDSDDYESLKNTLQNT
jgi:uncharacterized protein YejL (UPF0352 family)